MAGKLNARKVETLTKPGRHSDHSNNLYLIHFCRTAASGGCSSTAGPVAEEEKWGWGSPWAGLTCRSPRQGA